MGIRQVQAVQLSAMPATTCIACGTGEFGITRLDDTHLSLRTCKHCGTSETCPKPDPASLEAHYSENYYGTDNVKFVPIVEAFVGWMNRKRAARVHALVAGRARILEVGCGRGLLLHQLAQLGHDCHGTERSALAARRASQTQGLHIYTQPLEECPFDGHSFDAAILWHVLEHLDDPQKTLALIARLLKPKGVVYLEVPNLASLQSRTSGKNWFHLDPEHHLYHFSPVGLHRLLETSGFQIEQRSTLSLEQGPYGVLQSWLNAIGREKGTLYRILKRESFPGLMATFREFAMAAGLVLPALLFALMEAAIGRGGVLRVVARPSAR